MSAFKDRLLVASIYEKQIFSLLKEIGFDVAMNGTEHHYPDFVKRLRQSKDQTSLSIRYQPDGVISIGNVPQSCFIDPKAGKTIEKDAYLQYRKLCDIGNRVILIFAGFNNAWNFIENIKLIPANETTDSFKPEHRHPIVDGWITPRASIYWMSHLRFKNRLASGTPYREVDKTSLYHWMSFKQSVSQLLCQKATD